MENSLSTQENLKKLEKELRRRNHEIADALAFQNQITNSVAAGIFAYTLPERKIIVMNTEAQRIFGVEGERNSEDAVFKHIMDDIMKTNGKPLSRELKKLKKNRDSVSYIFKVCRGEKILSIDTTSKFLEFADGKKFVLSTMRDISETERLNCLINDERHQYRDALIKNSEYFYSFDVTEGVLHDDVVFTDGRGMVTGLGLSIPAKYDSLFEAAQKKYGTVFLNSNHRRFATCSGILEAFACGVTNVSVETRNDCDNSFTRTSMLFSKSDNGHVRAFMVAHNITEERRREFEAQENLEKAYEISKSFAKVYFATWILDLEHGTIKTLDVPDFALAITNGKDSGSIKEALSMYVDDFVLNGTREKMRAFFDLQTLGDRLEGLSMISEEYNGKVNGWCRACFFPVRADDSEATSVPKQIILAVQKIGKEREATNIIESLSHNYFCSYLIDIRKNTYKEVKSVPFLREFFGKTGDALAKIKVWIPQNIPEKYHAEIDEFMDFSTIDERMKDRDALTIDYETEMIGWCQGMFTVVDRFDDGNVKNLLYSVRNVNDEKEKEVHSREALQNAFDTAEKANRAKTKFLSSMSHDIRTPMNAIIGMTAIAGMHLDDKARVQDCLQKITAASKHLLGLINEVLDMSKIESGKIDLQVEAFNLSDLIDSILTIIKPQILEKKHELVVNIYNIQHEKVLGDSQRLEQAFMNLISNAIKYTNEGGTIKISATERATTKSNVGCYEFIFEDNGIGMSEEYISHLFEPFSRADDERVSKIQGTGLGMPITKNIVQMMNGNIKCESRLNKGTKFTVTVFLALQNDDDRDIEEFADLGVLVCDDDIIDCQNACHVLDELGMKSEYVMTGSEAVDLVVVRHKEERDFFAVILDWKMPGMDGVETTRQIRKQVGAEVPIIIISAYDWSEIEDEARKAGADAFISKPLFKSRVAETFSRLLGHEETERKDFSLSAFENSAFEGKRVLLVEDNEINAEITTEILKMAGLEVEEAENGKIAVDKMAAASDGYYDIIFMDIQMPIKNGYEAAREIRAMDRDYARTVPIIAMTANAFSDDIIAAKNAGMNEHIAKPLKFEILLKTLKTWLE